MKGGDLSNERSVSFAFHINIISEEREVRGFLGIFKKRLLVMRAAAVRWSIASWRMLGSAVYVIVLREWAGKKSFYNTAEEYEQFLQDGGWLAPGKVLMFDHLEEFRDFLRSRPDIRLVYDDDEFRRLIVRGPTKAFPGWSFVGAQIA